MARGPELKTWRDGVEVALAALRSAMIWSRTRRSAGGAGRGSAPDQARGGGAGLFVLIGAGEALQSLFAWSFCTPLMV